MKVHMHICRFSLKHLLTPSITSEGTVSELYIMVQSLAILILIVTLL